MRLLIKTKRKRAKLRGALVGWWKRTVVSPVGDAARHPNPWNFIPCQHLQAPLPRQAPKAALGQDPMPARPHDSKHASRIVAPGEEERPTGTCSAGVFQGWVIGPSLVQPPSPPPRLSLWEALGLLGLAPWTGFETAPAQLCSCRPICSLGRPSTGAGAAGAAVAVGPCGPSFNSHPASAPTVTQTPVRGASRLQGTRSQPLRGLCSWSWGDKGSAARPSHSMQTNQKARKSENKPWEMFVTPTPGLDATAHYLAHKIPELLITHVFDNSFLLTRVKLYYKHTSPYLNKTWGIIIRWLKIYSQIAFKVTLKNYFLKTVFVRYFWRQHIKLLVLNFRIYFKT